MNAMQWLWGLLVSLGAGAVVSWAFLAALRGAIGLGAKPQPKTPRVPPLVMGTIERLVFTVIVAFQAPDAVTAMLAWLALKLAANWNQPELQGSPNRRAFALSALLGGLVSMCFALIGGLICAGKIHVGI